MTLPTRAELHTEVDRQFRERFPDAPERLDPDDPAQSDLVEHWLQLRDEVVNDWTDSVFARHFPQAGKLDPNDPADSTLVEYWLDIRDQIRDDAPARYHWDSAASDATQPQAEGAWPSLLSVSAETGGHRLVFDGPVQPTVVGSWLWPDGVPSGVQLSSAGPNDIHLAGVSWEAYQSMRSDVAGMIAAAGVITAEPYEPGAGQAGTGSDPTSGADVAMDKDAQREVELTIKHWLEGAHELGAVAEVTAYLAQAGAHLSHGTAAAGAVEGAAVVAELAAGVLGTVGSVAFVAWVGFEVVDTFRGEKRREETQGYVYGLMWGALGEPDQLPAFAPGITYSAEEHEQAFRSGVRKGRDKASDVKIKNHIIVSVGVLAAKTGFGETWAAQQVLSEIWRQSRERAPGEGDDDLLNWPKPWDRTVLGW